MSELSWFSPAGNRKETGIDRIGLQNNDASRRPGVDKARGEWRSFFHFLENGFEVKNNVFDFGKFFDYLAITPYLLCENTKTYYHMTMG